MFDHFASFVSENILITAAAYVSLTFTLTYLLWLKFAELVHAIWSSFKRAVWELIAFCHEFRRRIRSEPSRTRQPDASP